MQEIGAVEARETFESLLGRVAAGEAFVIVENGRAVARLVPDRPGADRDRARRAAANILRASRGVTLGGITLRELIDEGRR